MLSLSRCLWVPSWDITERGLFRLGTVWAHPSHMMRQRISPQTQTNGHPPYQLRKVRRWVNDLQHLITRLVDPA